MSLLGKVAIVTGGASGIGRGIVLALAKEGAKVMKPSQPLDMEKMLTLGRSPLHTCRSLPSYMPNALPEKWNPWAPAYTQYKQVVVTSRHQSASLLKPSVFAATS